VIDIDFATIGVNSELNGLLASSENFDLSGNVQPFRYVVLCTALSVIATSPWRDGRLEPVHVLYLEQPCIECTELRLF
jgi:hypothetical protein